MSSKQEIKQLKKQVKELLKVKDNENNEESKSSLEVPIQPIEQAQVIDTPSYHKKLKSTNILEI